MLKRAYVLLPQTIQLHIPHLPVHEKTQTMIGALSPETPTRPLLPASLTELQIPTPLTEATISLRESSPPNVEMSIDTLIRFSARYIMDLASSPNPPALLRERNEETVKAVDLFLNSIQGMKAVQQ